MDLSLAKTNKEAELRAVEQHLNICRCFTCGSKTLLRPNYHLRKARQASSIQNPEDTHNPGMAQEKVDS